MSRDNQQNHRIDKIEKHISVINGELGEVKIELAVIKAIVQRHDKLFWLMIGGLVAILTKLSL